MAPNINACAASNTDAGITRSYLLLTLSNSQLRANALVLVRFHQTTHSLNFTADNDPAVNRICLAVLPYMSAAVHGVNPGETRSEISTCWWS